MAGSIISSPTIIPRSEHPVSRALISKAALKVLYQLKDAGYQSFLVGGCVRDLMLGREPKDFDITTDASPDQVKSLFGRSCRLIGRRFRLAHVRFGREIIEVATFRAQHSGEEEGGVIEDGRILRDNVFGTVEEDAWRRDFTVNALYYNIRDFSVVDYVGGVDDLQRKVLHMIGDAETRYREDPVRMLRAARFAAKLGFTLHVDSERPIVALAPLLQDIPPSRLFEEVLKLFQGGYALKSFEKLRHYALFGAMFPFTEQCLVQQKDDYPLTLLRHAMENTDVRILAGKPVTPAFLFAALLWEPLRQMQKQLVAHGKTESQAMQDAARQVLVEQSRFVMLPKRFALRARDIWHMQPRLLRNKNRRALLLLEHVSFRAAYDFLLLRAESGEDELKEQAEWWTKVQEVSPDERLAMCEVTQSKRRTQRRRKKSKSGSDG